LNYRAEIDGIRALAIIPVILFHADFTLFSGGFVGVDVFFVISGYLITTILIEDIETNRFSLVKFYERRARRILPALFFVMLVCSLVFTIVLLPDEVEKFGQSLVATTLFANNILLSITTGYWQLESSFKPLLHTWSLGVEEQYYVVFPIFLYIAWRLGKAKVFWAIVLLAGASLLLGELGRRINPNANFYLAHTRAWELFAGSIAAFVVQARGVRKNEPLSLLGLVAIVFAVFAYDQTTPFPGLSALLPVIGAVMLLLFAGKETSVAKLLSTKPLVVIGLISYSAYLWHQPILVLFKALSVSPPGVEFRCIALMLTACFAVLSYKFIEAPFRDSRVVSTRLLVFLAVLTSCIVLSIGLLLYITSGFAKQFYGSSVYGSSQKWITYNEQFNQKFVDPTFLESRNESDPQRKKHLLVIGNSYGRDFSNALGEVGLLNGVSFLYVHSSTDGFSDCEIKNSSVLPIEILRADIIVFGFQPITNCSLAAFSRMKALDTSVYFAGVKNFGFSLAWLRVKKLIGDKLELECGPRLDWEVRQNDQIARTFDTVNILDIQSLIACNQNKGVFVTNELGQLLSADRTHLTAPGAMFLGKKLLESDNNFVLQIKNSN
jgi:peptidoglycan/LPS O-acetylase OafA/YrhL